MAKDKDRAQNPATAQLKADKQKALKKGKAQIAAQRTERLAARNPHRLETQIADLRSLRESSGGKLNPRDKKQLEDLERDVERVKKARANLGDRAPSLAKDRGNAAAAAAAGGREDGGRGRGGGDRGRGGRAAYGGLGKRGRFHGAGDHKEEDGTALTEDDSEETDEEVRKIPWPRDTPPPIPHRRRPQYRPHDARSQGTSANTEPLGPNARYQERNDASTATATTTASPDPHAPPDTSLPAKPTIAAAAAAVRTTYSSAPQVRNLREEATKRFMPSVVRRKIDATKGTLGGKLLEEDEVQRLEGEGYGQMITATKGDTTEQAGAGRAGLMDAAPAVPERDLVAEVRARKLREEEEAFQRALGDAGEDDAAAAAAGEEYGGIPGTRNVQIEEASDEDL